MSEMKLKPKDLKLDNFSASFWTSPITNGELITLDDKTIYLTDAKRLRDWLSRAIEYYESDFES